MSLDKVEFEKILLNLYLIESVVVRQLFVQLQ